MAEAIVVDRHSAAPRRLSFTAGRGDIDWAGYALVAFFGVPFLIFNVGPVLFGVYVGFTEWGIIGAPRWVGLENYQVALADPWVRVAFNNTSTTRSSSCPA